MTDGTPTVASLAQRLVRAFVRSMQIEGLREPLSVLDEMRLNPDALLRRSPALLEALAVVAAEIRHASSGSRRVRQSQSLSPVVLPEAESLQARPPLHFSVSVSSWPHSRRGQLYAVGAEGMSSKSESGQNPDFGTTLKQDSTKNPRKILSPKDLQSKS